MTTQAMITAAENVNRHWKYKKDGKADNWDMGVSVGDCEDYALSVLYELCGRSRKKAVKMLMNGDAQIIYTKTPQGAGHAVLYYNGHYIDNRSQKWTKKFNYTIRKPYSRGMIALKLTFGRIF